MTIVVADTTAGLPRETTTRLGIPLIPQIVVFGEDSYRDDTELDTATFMKKLRAASGLPQTAAPSPALYAPIFEQALKRGESVVVVAPSAKVSGTVRAATVAAQDFPGLDVRIVDSLSIAGNLGGLVLAADGWAKEGADADAIVQRLEELVPRGRTYFLVDTLEYLQKGGRIGGARALLGEMLQVKPILTIRAGQVEPFEQQRTKKRALARLAAIVVEQCPRSADARLSVMHAEASEDAEALAYDLRFALDLRMDIPVYELPPAIVVHAGPRAMAVGFFVE
ncbi:MAG: DegV family protein [Anaerolineales bacterium]|nr:DegV family protein [Anaerolineales bacterium]